MTTTMFDLFLSRAGWSRIEAWQIGQRTVTDDEAKRRLSVIELSSDDGIGPRGGLDEDRQAIADETFGAQAWSTEAVIFTIGTYEGGMWVYCMPRNPPPAVQ